MKLHEYQAKQLFAYYGIKVPKQYVVTKAEEASRAAREIGGPVVIKAQVLVGGRGKAGGVKPAPDPAEAERKAWDILALTIKGERVGKIIVSPAADIRREYYVGLILDRTSKDLVLMMSAEGGVDIEELAVSRPDAIVKFHINPLTGIDESALGKAVRSVFGDDRYAVQAEDLVKKLYAFFTEKDASLVEINPYALLDDDTFSALDAKMTFDDNALFRHPDIEALRNSEEESDDERDAKLHGLSFVSMDGEIGCIVNGAGLAMATMDIIKLAGGNPANFLDVGGSSSPRKMIEALRIITKNPKVKAILVNIFGGITRCDDIANGILQAMKTIRIGVPLVVRLIGTNDEEGRRILSENGFQVSSDLGEAVRRAVASAEGGAAV